MKEKQEDSFPKYTLMRTLIYIAGAVLLKILLPWALSNGGWI
ncbi:MAG: hypothetical protein WC374_13980 [Phycisphaerae bacterium]|jgi:hypothetical protein